MKYTRSKKYRRHKLKTQKGGYFWRRSTKINFNKARTAIVNAKMKVDNYCTKIKDFMDKCLDCDKNILINDMNSCQNNSLKSVSINPNINETFDLGLDGFDNNDRANESKKKKITREANHLLELNRIRTNPFTCLFCNNEEENKRLENIQNTYNSFIQDEEKKQQIKKKNQETYNSFIQNE